MENHGENHGIVFLNFCGNPDPSCLTLMVLPKEFFQDINFEKFSRRQKSMQNYHSQQRVDWAYVVVTVTDMLCPIVIQLRW